MKRQVGVIFIFARFFEEVEQLFSNITYKR